MIRLVCIYLQSVDMYGCPTSTIHCVVVFICRFLSFSLSQRFFFVSHFSFFLLNPFRAIQHHLQTKREGENKL